MWIKNKIGPLTGLNVFFLHHAADRVKENAEEETVVLKVDVIDDQESCVEEHEAEQLDAAFIGLADTLPSCHAVPAGPHTQCEHQIGQYHRKPLEGYCLGRSVVQVGHLQHLAVEVDGHFGEGKLEPCEQRRVV